MKHKDHHYWEGDKKLQRERTVSATNMPDEFLDAYLRGRFSFEEAYALYPGPDIYSYEVKEEIGEANENKKPS